MAVVLRTAQGHGAICQCRLEEWCLSEPQTPNPKPQTWHDPFLYIAGPMSEICAFEEVEEHPEKTKVDGYLVLIKF